VKRSDMQVIDLYGGCGGMGTGFNNLFNVVQAVEKEYNPYRSYQENHRETDVINDEVGKYLQTVIKKDFEALVGCSGIVGGPPCQEFSVLNQKKDYGSKRANQLFVMIEAV